MWERVRKALLASLSVSSMHLWKWVRAFWSKNGLLTLSMLSVATGCLLGFLLRALELTELVRCWGQDGSEGDGAGPAVGAATEGHGHKGKGFCPRKGLLMDGFCLWPFFFFFFPPKTAGQILAPSAGSGGSGPDPVRLQEPAGGMGMGRGGSCPTAPRGCKQPKAQSSSAGIPGPSFCCLSLQVLKAKPRSTLWRRSSKNHSGFAESLGASSNRHCSALSRSAALLNVTAVKSQWF